MENKPQIQRSISTSNKGLLSTKILRDNACRNISANVGEIIEERLLMKRVILDRLNDNLLLLKSKGIIKTLDAGGIELIISEDKKKKIISYKDEDIVIGERRIEKITINGREDNIYFFPINIKGIKFSLISVPNGLKQMKLSQTYVGNQFDDITEIDCLPHYDLKKITIGEVAPHFLIIGTNHLKDKTGKTIIEQPLISNEYSMLQEIAMKGFTSNPIIESIILTEIIANRFGIGYINYPGRKGDSDEIGYEDTRKQITNICDYFGINDLELTYYINPKNIEVSVAVKSIAPYKNRKGVIEGVVVGDCMDGIANQFPNTGTLGSIFSLDLSYGTSIAVDPYGIRPSLGLY